ncbi:hypothetical protein FRB91_001005 [Serendipita sp. 411]|nr:hypothetical protein FRB91_001005 [Serendipita sp. 411]
MVLLLEEADDPNAKLLPSSIPVTRISIEDFTDDDLESFTDDSSARENEETVTLIARDPPPSYNDVQSFRERIKSEQQAVASQRARRRFRFSLMVAIVLILLPALIALVIKLSSLSQNTVVNDPVPSVTSDDPDSPQETKTTSTPNGDFPWDRYPPPRGGPGGGGGDHGRGGPGEHPPPHGEKPNHGGGGDWHGPGDGRNGPEHHPPGKDEGNAECSDWTQQPLDDENRSQDSFNVEFKLRYVAPIFVRSLLEEATGSFRVKIDGNLKPEAASLSITATSEAKEHLAKACLSRRGDGASEIRLLASKFMQPTHYAIQLSLSPRQQRYPGLGTYLHKFTQSYDEMSSLEFRFIDIDGPSSDVSAAGLSAVWLSINTDEASIDGAFTAKRQLDITGNTKPISITANMCSERPGPPTFAKIVSSRGAIDAKLVLADCRGGPRQDPPNSTNHYDFYISNSDAPLSLQVEHGSLMSESSLHLNVSNADTLLKGTAHTSVTLDQGFEGGFDIRALSSSTPVSVKNEDATDDKGGSRYIEMEKVRGEDGQEVNGLVGKVLWESRTPLPDGRRSQVSVNTLGEGEVNLLLLGD